MLRLPGSFEFASNDFCQEQLHFEFRSATSVKTIMESTTPALNGRVCAGCHGPGKLTCSSCRLVVVSTNPARYLVNTAN